MQGLVRLRGDHEENGFTTVNCVLGLAPTQLIAAGWIIGCIAWALFMVGRSVLWLSSEGRLEVLRGQVPDESVSTAIVTSASAA